MDKLIFANNSYLYFLAFILIPSALLYRAKFYVKGFNVDFLSKRSTDQYRGLCILIVIIHHIAQGMQEPAFMHIFIKAGEYAVCLFFFLSGYGLAVSHVKKKDYLQGFIFKKLMRIYLPFVFINILTLIVLTASGDHNHEFAYLIKNALGITLQLDTTQWFIMAILLFYLFFWMAFKYFDVQTAPLIIVLLVAAYMLCCRLIGVGGWWYASSLVFPLGIYIGLNRKYVITLFSKYYPFAVLSAIASCCLLVLLHVNGGGLIFTLKFMPIIFMVLLILFKIAIFSKVFGFIGVLSLEMYLIHMKVYHLYFPVSSIRESYNVYVYIAFVVAIAFVLHRLFNSMQSVVERKVEDMLQTSSGNA